MRMRTIALTLFVCLFTAANASRAQTPPLPGWVVLPVDEYRDLRTRAGQAPPSRPAAAEAAFTRLEYALRFDGEVVVGQASLVVDILGDGWASVPLPGGLAVREARLDGQPLVIAPGPPPTAHLSRAGRAVLALDVVFTPTPAAGVDTITLPPSAAAVTRVTLVVPGTTHVVSAAGGVVADRASDGQSTTWTVHGRSATPLVLSWARRRSDPRTSEPLRLRGRLETTTGLRDTLLQVATSVEVEVLQGVAREVALDVPDGVTVTAVSGPLVDEWRVDGAVLRVALLEAVASSTTCVIRAESHVPPGAVVTVPLLRLPTAERETGRVSVDVGGEAEVVAATTRGLEPLDSKAVAASPRIRAFQLTPAAGGADRALALTLARYTPEAVPVATVDEARYRVLAAASGALLVEAQYLVRNNQRSGVTVTLPAGVQLWQARVGDRQLRPGVVDGGRVLLPLDAAPTGSEPVAVVASLVYLERQPAWVEGAAVRLVLPALDLPVARTGVLLHHPPAVRLEVRDGAFRRTDDLGGFAAPIATPRAVAPRPPVDDTRAGAAADVVALVTRVRRDRTERAGLSPDLPFGFPTVGPAVFLRSELTAEATPPTLSFVLRSSR